MNSVLPLRIALRANAVFSISSGLFLLSQPELVGDWLGLQAPFVIRVVGVGLLIFAADLLHQAGRRRVTTWRALFASAGDFLWVVGTVVLLVLFPDGPTQTGRIAVVAVAVAVFDFGAWQLWAIARAHRASSHGDYRHCIVVEVNAPPEAMWQVISRLGDIQNYMRSLKWSVLDAEEPGVGTVRTCEDHRGRQWSEECIAFEIGRGFSVRFLAEAPNFPFPAKAMVGGWEVSPSSIGSRVMVWWELVPKQKLLAPIILPLLALQADRDFPRVIQRMAAHAVRKSSEETVQRSSRVVARLLPSLC